jgi:hypothetical protein
MVKSKSFTKTKFWQTWMLIGSIFFMVFIFYWYFNEIQQQQQQIWLIIRINIYKKKFNYMII